MTDTLEAFRHFRFFALDTRTYEGGALPAKTKSIVIPHLRRAVARLEKLPDK